MSHREDALSAHALLLVDGWKARRHRRRSSDFNTTGDRSRGLGLTDDMELDSNEAEELIVRFLGVRNTFSIHTQGELIFILAEDDWTPILQIKVWSGSVHKSLFRAVYTARGVPIPGGVAFSDLAGLGRAIEYSDSIGNKRVDLRA